MEHGPGETPEGLDSLLAEVDADPRAAALLARLQAVPKPAPMPDPAPRHQGPTSKPEILAAISDTFTLAELRRGAFWPGGAAADSRPSPAAEFPLEAVENALLAGAQPVLINGLRRLKLRPAVRADILRRARLTEEYDAILDEAQALGADGPAADLADPVRAPTVWLRKFLGGKAVDLASATLDGLRGALTAMEDLSRLSPNDLPRALPSLAETRRRLGLAELLEPLQLLVGAGAGGQEGRRGGDRFVGRRLERDALKAFVDELESTSVRESVQRGIANTAVFAGSVLGGGPRPGLFRIEAQGGLGKSALMAKFVLEHAMDQKRPFPFIYFDFDRASLPPREPRRLLMEAVRQIALQYPDEASGCTGLLASMTAEEIGAGDPDFDAFAAFRRLIHGVTDRGRRAFLVVLDTMEVVQYDPAALAGVEAFLRDLAGGSRQDAAPGLNQMRVVAAGRAGLESLEAALNPKPRLSRVWPLEPLSFADAEAMAETLGRSLLGEAWKSAWNPLIAGSRDPDPHRREPLSIRVAVELVRHAAPEGRETLVARIGEEGEDAAEGFVGRLYQRRVLEHVQDDEVRKIAWPGLVVRRVTVELVRDLLAERCGIDPGHAADVFEKLAREVWIVERQGDALIHRRDLRSRTLPLMRRLAAQPPEPNQAPPATFAEINEAAIEYFRSRAASSSDDHAEWIYHRLLAGENLLSVEADWTPEMVDRLARAVDDFDPESLAGKYLAARTARQLMAPDRVLKLPSWLALEHLARTAPELGGVGDTAFSPLIETITDEATAEQRLPPFAERTRQVLLVRTGRWDEVRPSVLNDIDDERAAHALAFWEAHLSVADRPTADDSLGGVRRMRGVATRPPSIRLLAQRLAAARLADSPEVDDLDDELTALLDLEASGSGQNDLSTLRTIAVFGRRAVLPAARAWLRIVQTWPGHRVSFALAEIRAVGGLLGGAGDFVETIQPLIARLEGFPRRRSDPSALRIGDPSVTGQVLKLMQALTSPSDRRGRDNAEAVAALRRLFAARHEDWVTVMGYAAWRASGADMAAELVRRSNGYAALDTSRSKAETGHLRRELATDPLALLRYADEAGDLTAACEIVLRNAPPSAARDGFARLLGCLRSWQEGVEAWIVRSDSEAAKLPMDRPPAPPPVRDPRDPQKHRWGGLSEQRGRRLSWRPLAQRDGEILFTLVVSSIDGSPLQGPVVFHLHDTFARPTYWIRRIRDGHEAHLEEIRAWGAFTAAAQVRDAQGQWIGLELDLAEQGDMPMPFRER